ncbi:regulator of G-protein signaling 14 isoform X1 [Oncorhynchus kisutch]|uniref:Regulator of G protein signaling 14a n=2 Tax=Oncorhynchus kisutch TaxID=8019 RepID=A0A8C7N5F4_ONCKI|nr:regulator of G-protein signaling 14 isoform X1 [Oncorhynchus kisutch]XP_031645783.1 regulator of G-protein signaling 14 isoform X1 [Oncorhynchus kisutch]XP_031645784.1 regulator of G-protein signaling 14 isoform X1 [Oncorhynchus kisutch]
MVAFSGLCRSLSWLAKRTAQYKFGKLNTYNDTCPPTQIKSQAVSDGELNMSGRGCGGSCTSLPEAQGGDAQASSVVSWAVSFETLLEDPMGVCYFKAFLRSEVSAENILFYQACEKYREIPPTRMKELSEEAHAIFQTYLSDHAPYAVNIDDTARVEEKDLLKPTAEMFDKAQKQILKLMKMDSYRRFVRSPLYQKCTLASVEGRPLPNIPAEPTSTGSWENMATFSRSLNDNKKQRDKQREKRGSWGVDLSYTKVNVSRKDYRMSNSSVENGRSGPSDQGQGDGCGSVEGGYCCVYLPDGSASLAPIRPGLTLREMLSGLCEKRGFPLKDIIIYLHGKDRKPLSLEQDCSILRHQQVSLELRVTFALEVVFTGKTVGIMVKSSKTLQDALSVVLQKHQLASHQARVTMSGSDVPLSMSTSVFKLANKKLQLDKVGSPRISGQTPVAQESGRSPVGPEVHVSPQADGPGAKPRVRKNHEMEVMIELLSRAQACRVDDQRGLLTKEHLELPQFLLKPPVHDQETQQGEAGEESLPGGLDLDKV